MADACKTVSECHGMSQHTDPTFAAGRLELDDLEKGLQVTELPQGPSLEWLQKQLLQHLLPKLAPEAGSRVEGRPHRTSTGPSRTSIPEFVANLQRFCTQLGSTLQQLNGGHRHASQLDNHHGICNEACKQSCRRLQSWIPQHYKGAMLTFFVMLHLLACPADMYAITHSS